MGHGGAGAAPTASARRSAPGAVDPKIDALARAVLACKTYDQSFDLACPAMKAWNDAKDDFNEGKADASLVAMLADPDEKIRYLGAYKLNQYGKAYATDKALAGAVVAAAEKETSKFAGYEVGAAVGRVLVRETGTFDRVKALVKKHELAEVRRGILSTLLFNNQDHEPVYNLVRDAVKDSDKSVAQQALSSFWVGGGKKMDATCQLYVDHLENPNDDLAASANNYLSWYKRCATKYDALLDSLERRVKAGSVTSISYVMAARHVCEDVKATDGQRKRGAAIGRAVARKKDGKSWIRSAALDTVMKCDAGDGGRAFVGTFAKDPEKSLADKAAELLAKK